MEVGLIGLKSLRIFFSYSTKDKVLVSEIKKHLESFGFEIFLAHEDLKPCVEWQDEIIKNLKRCDIFIALLTEDFKKSDWTSQELGMALINDKFIIPLQVNVVPFGFISKIQGLRVDQDNLALTTKNIVKTIINKSKFGEDIKAFVINSFITSNTFEDATTRTKALMELDEFTEEQIKRIYNVTKENNQIYSSWGARGYLKKLFLNNKHYFTDGEFKEIIQLLSD